MALRRQIPESRATWADPVRGLNLFDSEEDLVPGDARLMQNCVYRSGTRMRNGNTRVTPTALGASLKVRGGHRYYFGGATPQKTRLLAYGTKIVTVSDTGVEVVLNSGMTNDKDTFFTTWSISDIVYIANPSDVLRQYDGTTFSTVTGTAIPTARTGVVPILDRLLAITTNGIERSNPRSATVWSTNSAWATFRPSRVGLFTALHPFTLRGVDTLYPGALAFQPNAYYVITGTNFGADVTAASAPTGEDSSIKLLDPNVGCSSPYSVTTVPGVGIFWFTTDLNVYFVPEGSLSGRYVGDRLRSNSSTAGIESVNKAALDQVWMTYFDRYLILGIPVGSNTYATTQFWGDLRTLTEGTDFPTQPRGAWYGPMTGQTIGRVWREDQQGEFQLRGGEGNSVTGVFVYNMLEAGRFQDAVGTADTNITMAYQSYFKGFGAASREKYIRSINLDLNNFVGTPTLDLLDLDGNIITGVAITAV